MAIRKTSRQKLDEAMTEAQLEDSVAQLAKMLGYLIFHPQTAIRENKKTGKKYWLTAYKGDKGFPDWTYARRGKVLLVEFKKEKEYPDVSQKLWLQALGEYGRLWRPSDLSSGLIEKTLREL